MIAINISTFPASGGEFTIEITKSDYLLWSSVIVPSESWYNVISSQQTGQQTWEIVVEVEENLVAAERFMEILVETEAEQETFRIIQEAASVPAPTGSIVSVTPSGDIPAAGGNLTVDVAVANGNDALTSGQVSTGTAYCSLSSVTHGVQSGGQTVTRFVFAVTQNTSISSRAIGLQFTVSNGTKTEILTLSKSQAGATPAAPSGSIMAVTPSGNIPASGGTLVYDVEVTNGNDALTSASITTGAAYVTLQSTTHGVQSGDDVVTRFVFAVAANNTTSARNIGIDFTVSNGTQTATISATKTQAGTVAPSVLAGDIVSETPAGNIAASGGTLVYDVEVSNGDDNLTGASVVSGNAYCTLQSITHGVSSGGRTVTRIVFSFAQNTTYSARSASFAITVSDGTDTLTISASKTQNAAVPVNPSGQIMNESPEGNVPATGGALIYDVRVVNGTDALTTATIETGSEYVTFQKVTHGIISGGYVISRFVFVVAENQATSTRNIAIRFNFSDGTLAGSLDAPKTQNAAVSQRIVEEPNFSVLPWYTSLKYQDVRKWWNYGKIYPLYTPAGTMLPFQIIRSHRETTEITSFVVYTAQGVQVGDFTQEINDAGISIKQFPDAGFDVIVFPGLFPVFSQMENGQYYASIADGSETWYSDIFTVVNDIEPYLKIEWWDKADFITDGGTVVYTEPDFKNVLYLDSDIAKPEYVFDEEGETRDGYFFPVKQISEKRYRFSFFAPEYLLDVIRLIRMADYVKITYNGKTYFADSFLITPEWEDNGDIAVVDAEFETATVAKKLGLGYLRSTGGDFNNDYNNDFNN